MKPLVGENNFVNEKMEFRLYGPDINGLHENSLHYVLPQFLLIIYSIFLNFLLRQIFYNKI